MQEKLLYVRCRWGWGSACFCLLLTCQAQARSMPGAPLVPGAREQGSRDQARSIRRCLGLDNSAADKPSVVSSHATHRERKHSEGPVVALEK